MVTPDTHPELWHPTPEQAKEYSTKVLSEAIRQAKVAYYDGNPIISDFEYDRLETSLRAINPDAPILSEVGYGESIQSK